MDIPLCSILLECAIALGYWAMEGTALRPSSVTNEGSEGSRVRLIRPRTAIGPRLHPWLELTPGRALVG